jgi:diguanylate cyclase (GGDEF)-like protein
MVPNSVRFAVVGAMAGVAAPLGLLVYGLFFGRAVDPLQLGPVLLAGAVVGLATAGWWLGRKQDVLVRRNRGLEELVTQLRALSTTDPLTGIANRRALDDRLVAELARASRYATPLALVMIDLDLFKDLNDRFGHQVGDAMLKEVGGILASERRLGDFVARYGGEEFVAVLPHADGVAAQGWAERVRSRIEGVAIEVGGELARVTASFGVATATSHDETSETLLTSADQALYEAKTRGRNRSVLARQQASSAMRPAPHAKRAR